MIKNPQLHLVVKRKRGKILSDASRVITRFYMPDDPKRVQKIIQRVLSLSDSAAEDLLKQVIYDFSDRHKDIRSVFWNHLNKVMATFSVDERISEAKKELIGAYFTMEYSIESAALFNPSIVPHPNQDNLEKGSLRFIMSLRATGEGHLSSIVFRSGTLDANNKMLLDPVSEYVVTPNIRVNPIYELSLFQQKLAEMGVDNDVVHHLFNQLPEQFSYYRLKKNIDSLCDAPVFAINRQNKTFEMIYWLANSNYEVYFEYDHIISERVIFPTSKIESRGIEDTRFVQFFNQENQPIYYATYTAYNGVNILPQLMETTDFLKFKVSTLNGKAVQNKGMALFPRKVHDRYVMLSRQDGENNRIMFSQNIHFWDTSQIIQEPIQTWEFVQLGNCGSPIEINEGWLVLTHGVGPMRQYCIGAILLDKDHPEKVIAYLEEPLLVPHEEEREGYVPNVVYSCGSLIHNNELIIPYAMSDVMSGIATVKIDDLLKYMKKP